MWRFSAPCHYRGRLWTRARAFEIFDTLLFCFLLFCL
jgi:hypothetical protein